MDLDRIRKRIASADPLVIDSLVAIALAALVCLQLWAFSHGRPERIGGMVGGPGGGGFFMLRMPREEPGLGIYAIAALAFLPLAIRRKIPWLALVGSSAFALGYQFLHAPPAFVMAGPMLGIYSVAAYARRRHAGLVTALVAGLVLAVPAFAFSSEVFWLRESAGAFVMIAAAAFFGEAERNRRRTSPRSSGARPRPSARARRRRGAASTRSGCASPASCTTSSRTASRSSRCRPRPRPHVARHRPGRARESLGAHPRHEQAGARRAARDARRAARPGDGERAARARRRASRGSTSSSRPRPRGRPRGRRRRVDGDLEDVPAARRRVGLPHRAGGAHQRRAPRRAPPAARCASRVAGDDLDARGARRRRAAHARETPAAATASRGMRERVEALGGTFEAGPRAGAAASASSRRSRWRGAPR